MIKKKIKFKHDYKNDKVDFDIEQQLIYLRTYISFKINKKKYEIYSYINYTYTQDRLYLIEYYNEHYKYIEECLIKDNFELKDVKELFNMIDDYANTEILEYIRYNAEHYLELED